MLEHLSLQSLQLQPLLQPQLPRRHHRPRSQCPHSLGLLVVRSSRHCQRLRFFRTHRQRFSQSPSPSYLRYHLQGEVEERSLYFRSRRSRQPQQSRLQMLTPLLLTRLPLLRTLSQAVPAREPPRQQHLQSTRTRSSRLSPRVHRPTTTTTMTPTVSSPYRDSRTSSSPFWCFDAKGGEGVGVRGRVELERARSYQDFDALYHIWC